MSAGGRWTRGRQQQLIAEQLDVSVLNDTQRSLIVPLIFEQIQRPEITKAELLRFIFLSPELSAFRDLSNRQLAAFLRCSEGNVSRVLQSLAATPCPTVAVSPGRPTILSREAESVISDWLRQRISMMDWPTVSAFKDVVWQQLETEAPNFTPTHQFFYDLLARLGRGDLTVRSASGLDTQRYQVTPDMIQVANKRLKMHRGVPFIVSVLDIIPRPLLFQQRFSFIICVMLFSNTCKSRGKHWGLTADVSCCLMAINHTLVLCCVHFVRRRTFN